MRPSLKALRSRATEGAHRAAEGSYPPAGEEPFRRAEPGPPGAVERGTMRRRLRRARRMRDSLLIELGALVMEMHRQRRHHPALVERKASEALLVDREARGLARALGAAQSIREVVAAGIAGGCPACGALLATDDRFCARCGTPTSARNGARIPAPQAAAPPPPSPVGRAAPAPAPAPQLAARVAQPPPPPPPPPGARVPRPGALPPGALPPPDPGSRAPAPAPRSPAGVNAPPPDPTTRVRPPDADNAAVQMATGSTGR